MGWKEREGRGGGISLDVARGPLQPFVSICFIFHGSGSGGCSTVSFTFRCITIAVIGFPFTFAACIIILLVAEWME